jgi:hypothetical protein
MSDLFSIYEDSLNSVLRNITSVIETMHNLSKEKTESALNETNNNIKEAERIVHFRKFS